MGQDHKDLKKSGLKATLPRLKILSLFEHSEARHLSAEDVYKLLIKSEEDVGLATVYRVLTQFEQAGLLLRHHFESDKAVFELSDSQHHDHIVCIQCGHDVENHLIQTQLYHFQNDGAIKDRLVQIESIHDTRLQAPHLLQI